MAKVSILSATQCELGEGPFYCHRRNTVFWFDIVGKRRHGHNFDTGQEVVIDLPEMTSAMGITPDGRDVHLTETGLYLQSGEGWDQVVAIEADNANTRSNDARIHPCGAFWIGTMSKGQANAPGAIYRYFEGTLELMFPDIEIPNSICFSPDGTIGYYIDSAAGRLMQVAVNPDNGAPIGEPMVLLEARDRPGVVDGSVCDSDGDIWNARWGNASLDRYTPDGALAESIELPAPQTTCPVFVGNDRIVVTSAWAGMDDATRAQHSRSGETFMVEFDRPIGARYEPSVRL